MSADRPWEPDAPVDEAAAAELIARAFPDLAGEPTAIVGLGWDNLAVRVGELTLVRIAQRAEAAELLVTEERWLGPLSVRLPLPISAPYELARVPSLHPYPLCRYDFLPGRSASDGPWSREQRLLAAPVLGQFLRALHDATVSSAADRLAPTDTLGRMDLPLRLACNQPRKAELLAWLPEERTEEAFARMAALQHTAPHQGETVWCHGDLYARHVLIDEVGRPTGIIDWGDLHLGDPAVDLSLAYGLLPADIREAFWWNYGRVDQATRDRARFRSLHSSFCLIHYGHAVGDTHLLRAGQIGWNNALDGD